MLRYLDTLPEIRYIPELDPSDNIRALTYDGAEIDGKKTKVFAYMGFPEAGSENADPGAKMPAVVLVHGGGGHAYSVWVKMWNDAGYAAIAMDTTGFYPAVRGAGEYEGGDDSNKWIYGTNEEGYTNAPDNDQMANPEKPLNHQWMYHGVTDTILAHNILRANERVDKSKIGITGISWGGVITSLAIGYDSRYAFAIPIYGAGYLGESLGLMGKIFAQKSVKNLWSAEARFDNVKMPVFWFNWDYDVHFSANITSSSFRDTVKNNPLTIMSLKNQMGHSHAAGWRCRENFVFADSIVKGTAGLPRFEKQPAGRRIDCDVYIPEDAAVTANVYYLSEPMKYAYQNKMGYNNTWLPEEDWKSYPVEINEGRIVHDIAQTVSGYYVELAAEADGYRHVTTSEYINLR